MAQCLLPSSRQLPRMLTLDGGPSAASSSISAARRAFLAGAIASVSLRLPSLADALHELLPGLVFTIGGHKTSHRNKRQRSATKHLKRKTNIVNCPACGQPKLMHHLCIGCYTYANRLFKASDSTFAGHRIEPRLPTYVPSTGLFTADQKLEAQAQRLRDAQAARSKDSPLRPGSLASKLEIFRREEKILKAREDEVRARIPPESPASGGGFLRRFWPSSS